ncbi:MAG: hypothetical protein AAB522_00280 [Patescibacteria group bacterium]
MSKIIAGLLALWLMILGLAMMFRQHKRFTRWSGRQVQRPFLWAWNRWRREIMFFFAGIAVAKLMRWDALFWPILIAVGIALAIWVLGLITAHFAVRPDGAQRYTARSREILENAAEYLWENHRWPISWFFVGIIYGVKFIAR